MKTLSFGSITCHAQVALLLLGCTTAARGAPIFHTQSLNPLQKVPAVAGFQTTGADMAGMTVTAYFSDGTSEQATWTAAGSATGVTHNWSLSVPGDTYVATWTLSYGGGNGLLTGFSMDGFGVQQPGDRGTMFDRTLDGFGGLVGTPGSAKGRDMEEVVPLPFAVHARYVGAVDATSVPGPAFEDEFRWLNVRFFDLADTPIDEVLTSEPQPVGLDGFNLQVFEFRQDTNNVLVPEPASAVLAIVALVGFIVAFPCCRHRFALGQRGASTVNHPFIVKHIDHRIPFHAEWGQRGQRNCTWIPFGSSNTQE